MKKKCLSLFILLSFLVLQVLSPIGGKEVTVSAADGEEGVANLKYSFRTLIYGENFFTTSDSGQNTVLIFGLADDEDTQRTVKSIAESQWLERSDIRVVFAEFGGASLSDVHDFAMTYGGLGGGWGMSFCYDDTYGIIYQAMVDYYRLFSDSNEVDLPVTVLIDGKTDQIRHCLTGYQTADAIMDKMKDFVAAEPPAEPSQKPAETPAASGQQPVQSQEPVQSQGHVNLDYTFESVDGTSVSTRSNAGQATVLVFGFTTCGWTQKMMKSIAASQWVGRSDIRVVFAEINGASSTAVKTFAASYGCDDITFCYDEGFTIYYAAEKYYQQFYNGSESLGYPFTVLIDGENQVRDCILGYETADNILSKMAGFVDGSSVVPGQEPAPGEGVANFDYTFKKVDGTSVSTKSNAGQATVLVFGRTTCGNSQRTVKSIAASQWVGRSDIRVIFAEIDGASSTAVQTFAASYGCNKIAFCYDEGDDINRAMWKYYHLFSDSSDVTLPIVVIIDGKNQVRHCLTGYQTANAIMDKMKDFVAAEPTATPGQSPSKNSIIHDASGNTYQVTKSGKGNGTVTYKEAKKNQAATVKVPSKVSIGGVTYDVTSISAKAFRGNTKLKKVMIGKNVTSIGNSAFEGCTALKSIVIPSKVKSIGKNAFKNCKSLKSIQIKGNVLKTVGKNAFKGIHAKAKIKVPRKKLTAYKKRLEGKGQKKTVKITS